MRTEPARAPYQYNFSCCHRTVGITLYDAHDVLVTNLTIQGFQLDGINAHDRVEQATISGCVIRGNGRSGVSVGGAMRVDLASNLIGDNGIAQIRTEEACRVNIDSCDILEQIGRFPLDIQGGVIIAMERTSNPNWICVLSPNWLVERSVREYDVQNPKSIRWAMPLQL